MRTLSIFLALLLLGFTCTMVWADQPSDNEIYDKVRIRLAGDPDVKGNQLTVEVKNGDVTLRGKVESDRAKNKASKLAKKVKGVKNVANELTIARH
ncbi:MAG: BON domain-containing protein [Acidobacteriales bacterium]|nr:BON domain-containing protein [Terriglobales bacterium]